MLKNTSVLLLFLASLTVSYANYPYVRKPKPPVIVTKPGKCPVGVPHFNDNYCQTDNECPGNEKCCEAMFEQKVCVSPRHEIIPLPIRPPVIRRCPAMHFPQVCGWRDRRDECESQLDCGVGEQCCSTDCGTRCITKGVVVPPVPVKPGYPIKPIKPIKPIEKPGVCPQSRMLGLSIRGCVHQCSSDNECRGNRKCCSVGCGRACRSPITRPILPILPIEPVPLPPILEKPGKCPKVPLGQVGICLQECNGDHDCKGNKKCCSNGCGHVCKSPVQVWNPLKPVYPGGGVDPIPVIKKPVPGYPSPRPVKPISPYNL